MNIKEINSKKLFKEYEIEIPYEEVDNSINSKISEIMPTVSLPGFRKGKAPLSIVKKKYENNILNEVIEKIVEENTKKLLEEKNLTAFRQPKVEIKKYEKNKPVEISIKIDLDPEIKISSFDKIEIINRSIDLDKKSIDNNYQNFVDSQKHYHKISDNREVKISDKIIVNISTEDSLVPDFLKSQKNHPIVTDSEYQILPEISSKLIDKKAKIGDKIKLNFDLKKVLNKTKKYPVDFFIEIISIEHVHDFKVTKEFLEKNNFKDEKQLESHLKNNLLNQYQNILKEIQKKVLMDALEINNNFDVPEGILDEEFNSIWKRLDEAKKNNKLDEDDKGLTDPQLKDRYQKIAKRRVKLAILMQHIAANEKIIISEKELTDGMLQYASQYPGQEKQIFDYFKNNPSSVESIKGPIFEQKIVDHILTKVKTKDEKIDIKKFDKLQENTFKNKDIK